MLPLGLLTLLGLDLPDPEEPGLPGGGVGCTILVLPPLLGGVVGDIIGVRSGEPLVGVDGVDLLLICANFPVVGE